MTAKKTTDHSVQVHQRRQHGQGERPGQGQHACPSRPARRSRGSAGPASGRPTSSAPAPSRAWSTRSARAAARRRSRSTPSRPASGITSTTSGPPAKSGTKGPGRAPRSRSRRAGYVKKLTIFVGVDKKSGKATLSIVLSGRDKLKLEGSLADLAGARTWSAHLCDGTAVSVAYHVAADGTVVFDSSTRRSGQGEDVQVGLRRPLHEHERGRLRRAEEDRRRRTASSSSATRAIAARPAAVTTSTATMTAPLRPQQASPPRLVGCVRLRWQPVGQARLIPRPAPSRPGST